VRRRDVRGFVVDAAKTACADRLRKKKGDHLSMTALSAFALRAVADKPYF
jgi:hypothetical protein